MTQATETQVTATELVVIQTTELASPELLFKSGGTKTLIEQIAEKVAQHKSIVFDLTKKEDRKQIKEFATAINKSKTAIDNMGKEYVAVLKELPKKVDEERRGFREKMDDFRSEVLKPLEEWEAVEEQRIFSHKTKLDALRYCAQGDLSEESIERLESLKTDIEALTDWDFEEFEKEAKALREQAPAKLERAIEKRKEYDSMQAKLAEAAAQKAELERLQAEKEAQATANAQANQNAKLAIIAAEQAEINAKKAQEEAELKAKQAAEQAKAQAEAEFKAKQDAEQAEIAKREADKEHRKKIHKEIVYALVDADIPLTYANDLIIAIVNGNVPHLTINY